MAKHYRNKENFIFDTIVYLLVFLVLAVCLIPFIYILSASFSGSKPLTNGEVFLLPKEFNFNAYIRIFQSDGRFQKVRGSGLCAGLF